MYNVHTELQHAGRILKKPRILKHALRFLYLFFSVLANIKFFCSFFYSIMLVCLLKMGEENMVGIENCFIIRVHFCF